MKRKLAFLLCALIALTLLAGCGADRRVREAANEIMTYEPIDQKRTPLVVSKTGNINIAPLNDAFMALYPDVQIIELDITGGNATNRPYEDWIVSGLAPDLMFLDASVLQMARVGEYFENLSASPVIGNFQMEALNAVAVDANLYALPGPSKINCMLYNKTLFEQYGWQVPVTFDEFIALCARITQDTRGQVQPWNPNAKYSNEFLTVIEGFLYAELFGGAKNRAWYNDFLAGKETFRGHMEPYYALVQTLIDNDLLKKEHFTYSATTRGNEFADGKIAMYNYAVTAIGNDRYEFACMPFPTTAGDVGYICDKISCVLGMPKKERTQAVMDAAERYLAFFSSVEGQYAMIGDTLMVSNVKNVPLKQSEHLSGLQTAVDLGHMFALMEFKGAQGKANFSLYQHAQDMLSGEKTAEACIDSVDARPFLPADADATATTVLARAAENFTILETSCFLADLYREKADAEIGLIVNNLPYRGNVMRIFEGDLTDKHVPVLKPRSFDNQSTLVKASMTGRQLLAALNKPLGMNGAADAVYAFSGLKGKIAPWNPPGEKYLEIKRADGGKIEENRLYTVAFWAGTVYDEFITEILETYEGTFEELLTEKLTREKTVAPAKDGRITLVWR